MPRSASNLHSKSQQAAIGHHHCLLDSGDSSSISSYVDHILSTFEGLTPLLPSPTPVAASSPWAASAAERAAARAAGVQSESLGADNWGDRGEKPTVSWAELLLRLGAQPGDFLSVVVMQHARLGTLWVPIKEGVFQAQKGVRDSFTPHMRWRAMLRTAREVAAGLEHLHAHGVVHGDIKPGNILLIDSRADKRGFSALVSDFGLSRVVPDAVLEDRENTCGTVQYMAPEVILKGQFSTAADIYALGIMLWEMASGLPAYSGLRKADIIFGLSRNQQQRPMWPATSFHGLKDLYEKCVAQDPQARPTSGELVRALGEAEEALRQEAHAAARAAVAQEQAAAAQQQWLAAQARSVRVQQQQQQQLDLVRQQQLEAARQQQQQQQQQFDVAWQLQQQQQQLDAVRQQQLGATRQAMALNAQRAMAVGAAAAAAQPGGGYAGQVITLQPPCPPSARPSPLQQLQQLQVLQQQYGRGMPGHLAVHAVSSPARTATPTSPRPVSDLQAGMQAVQQLGLLHLQGQYSPQNNQ